MLSLLGRRTNYQGIADETLRYIVAAFEILEQIDQVKSMDVVNLGSAYLGVRDYTEAARILHQALARGRDDGHPHGQGHALECLAGLHMQLGELETAMADAEEALRVFRAIPYAYGEGIALQRMSRIRIRQRRFKEAVEFASRALEINENLKHDVGRAWSLWNLSDAVQGQAA